MSHDTRTQQASLGCGTLILIAAIVWFVSGASNNDLERDLRRLRNEVTGLRSTIDAQTVELKFLREQLQRPQPSAKPREQEPPREQAKPQEQAVER